MARIAGSNKKYIQAKKTVEKDLLIEGHVTDNLQTALDTMKDCMGSDNSAQTRMSASKWHIDTHAKYSKKHGADPKPADFVDSPLEKAEVVEESDNILEMKFGG